MDFRTSAVAAALAVAASVPLSGASHAQEDLDCRDFTYREEAQAVYDQDPSDPYHLDEEDAEPDDGVACGNLPSVNDPGAATLLPTPTPTFTSAPATRPSTASPSTTAPSASASPASPTVVPTPTRGVDAGSGGAVRSGDTEVAYGLALALGAAALSLGCAIAGIRRRAGRPPR